MKAFWRLLNYIWPQWHRICLVTVSALTIAVFFSLSIATIVPLLKVVMNEEGIRGWVNRNVCVWRYGMNFYVPATSDFIVRFQIAISLLPADDRGERIKASRRRRVSKRKTGLSVPALYCRRRRKGIPSSAILETLASADGPAIPVQVKRIDPNGNLKQNSSINCP